MGTMGINNCQVFNQLLQLFFTADLMQQIASYTEANGGRLVKLCSLVKVF